MRAVHPPAPFAPVAPASVPDGARRAGRWLWVTLTFFLGTFAVGARWDALWHTAHPFAGFFSPPHVFIYAGATVSALLVARLAWSPRLRAWYGPTVRHRLLFGTASGAAAIAGVGPVLLGFAGLVLDNAWHTRFGRDAVVGPARDHRLVHLSRGPRLRRGAARNGDIGTGGAAPRPGGGGGARLARARALGRAVPRPLPPERHAGDASGAGGVATPLSRAVRHAGLRPCAAHRGGGEPDAHAPRERAARRGVGGRRARRRARAAPLAVARARRRRAVLRAATRGRPGRGATTGGVRPDELARRGAMAAAPRAARRVRPAAARTGATASGGAVGRRGFRLRALRRSRAWAGAGSAGACCACSKTPTAGGVLRFAPLLCAVGPALSGAADLWLRATIP